VGRGANHSQDLASTVERIGEREEKEEKGSIGIGVNGEREVKGWSEVKGVNEETGQRDTREASVERGQKGQREETEIEIVVKKDVALDHQEDSRGTVRTKEG
jgi:hypothetical protein